MGDSSKEIDQHSPNMYLEPLFQNLMAIFCWWKTSIETETKAAKTLCIIMGCFCLCWAPFFVTNIVDPFVDYTVPGQVWTAFLWLGYINSGLNPFLYAFLNKSFRRAFLIILCCDDERYRRPSILGQTVPCSTTTINGSTHVLRWVLWGLLNFDHLHDSEEVTFEFSVSRWIILKKSV